MKDLKIFFVFREDLAFVQIFKASYVMRRELG